MKKVIISLLIGLAAGVAVMYFDLIPIGAKHVSPAGDSSYDAVTSKLDGGGDVYVYVGTEGVVKTVEETAQKIRGLVEQHAKTGEEKEKGLKVFDLVYNMIQHCGMLEIDGVGLSSVPMKDGLNHGKWVVHRKTGTTDGLIWRIMEPKPHPLNSLDLLPADTVLAGFADFKLKTLWEWIKKEAETSGLPELKKGVLSLEPMLEKQGLPLNKLLDSFGERWGIVMTLDSQKKIPIPMDQGPEGAKAMEIPDPGLAIVLAVKDDFIFNLLKEKLPFAKPGEDEKIKELRIPVPPMPITVDPVIRQADGWLIISSSAKMVDAMLASKGDGNGLTGTEEFKEISANVPGEGNRFGFLGRRFFRTIFELQRAAVPATAEEGAAMKDLMGAFQKEYTVYGVLQNNADGMVSTFNHNLPIGHAILLPATAAVGVIAAIAVPNLLTATQKGKQKATMGDMKTIAMAIESYITDHYEAPPGESLAEIRTKLEPFYIRTLPLKDAWGNDFHYFHGTGDKKDDYAVGSGGKDGVFNGRQQAGFYIVTSINGFNNDIILSNGAFTYGPKVK